MDMCVEVIGNESTLIPKSIKFCHNSKQHKYTVTMAPSEYWHSKFLWQKLRIAVTATRQTLQFNNIWYYNKLQFTLIRCWEILYTYTLPHTHTHTLWMLICT